LVISKQKVYNVCSDATVWKLLKVGSAFGFLHPKTAVSVFGFKKRKNIYIYFLKLKIETTVSVFGFEAKTGC